MGKGNCSYSLTTVLNHKPLNDERNYKHKDEHSISEDSREDIELLITQHTTVDLIKNLHKNKGLENHRVKNALGCWLAIHIEWGYTSGIGQVKGFSTVEKEPKYHYALVNSLSKDIAPHNSIDN